MLLYYYHKCLLQVIDPKSCEEEDKLMPDVHSATRGCIRGLGVTGMAHHCCRPNLMRVDVKGNINHFTTLTHKMSCK